jgi:Skp family chaperone for outer membrane proteins
MAIVTPFRKQFLQQQRDFMNKIRSDIVNADNKFTELERKIRDEKDEQKVKAWDKRLSEFSSAYAQIRNEMRKMETAQEDDWVGKRPQLENAVHIYEDLLNRGI